LTGMSFTLTSSCSCCEVINPRGEEYLSKKLLNDRETVGFLRVVLTSKGTISPLSSHLKSGKGFYVMREQIEFIAILKINNIFLPGFQTSGNMVQKRCLTALPGAYNSHNFR
jgi:hypothetical protein